MESRKENMRVSVELDYEIRYWTQTLACSKAELCRAVKKVGTCLKAVRKELMR